MKYNICVVQPEGYVHARAFDEVAILISAGLRDLGHITEIHKNKLDSNARNIIIGCHLLDSQSSSIMPEDTIILNTEQLSEEIGTWNKNILNWLAKYESWDYSTKNIENVKAAGLKSPKQLVLGYHDDLRKIHSTKKLDIDVLFYGSMNERRRDVLQHLAREGLTIKHLFGAYGEERDHWISRSKIVLNVHFFNSKIFEIVRCFYLMINQKAIISEVDEATNIDEVYRPGIRGVSYDQIVRECVKVCKDEDARFWLEEQSIKTISSLPQAKIMAKLVGN